jgi:O-antigen/teichoic acid export membrane protein
MKRLRRNSFYQCVATFLAALMTVVTTAPVARAASHR